MPTENNAETEQSAGEAAEQATTAATGSEGRDGSTKGAGTRQAAAEKVSEPDSKLIPLKFGANKSLRYHAARRSFFDTLHRGTMGIVAVGGSGAFVAIIGEVTEWAKWAALVLALAAALDVVIGYSESARRHDDLYHRWSDLVAEIIRYGPPTPEMLRGWLAERTLVEKQEPTPLAALNVICHNEEAEVQGYGDETIRHVRWYQRMFCHILTVPPNNFPTLKEWKQRKQK